MNEYLVKITTNQSLKAVQKHIEEKYPIQKGHWKGEDYIPETLIYQLPERGKEYTAQGLTRDTDCLRNRLNIISDKTTNLHTYHTTQEQGEKESCIRIDKSELDDLVSVLIDNKINGNGEGVTFYHNGMDFVLKDYSIERLSEY